MSENHIGGNLQNEITREEHDGTNNAKRVNVVAGGAGDGSILDGVTTSIKASVISTASGSALITYPLSGPTVYAVVNTGAAGVQNSMVTLNAGPNFIGLVTVGNIVNTTFSGNVTLDDGSLTGIIGNVTLSGPVPTGANYIGLASVNVANIARTITGNLTLSNANGFIGLVSVSGFANPLPVTFSGNVTLDDGSLTGIVGNITLSNPNTYIGLTTTTLGLGDRYIGLVTATSVGLQTLAPSPSFIGLVTAWTRNAGTTKTLVILPVGLGNNSLATVAVPTNANKINVTNLLLSSNVTTEVAIKSGVTYLTGNASLGVTLFPGGGFELPGSPDSPSWIGLPSGAMVVEKRDPGGTTSKIGGGVIYFDE